MTIISVLGLSMAMLVLAASPGPGVFATVARSLSSGFQPALAVIVGIVIGDIIYLMFAVFGLTIVARAMGELFVAVRLLGGAYLVWLGVRLWRSTPLAFGRNGNAPSVTRLGNVAAGLMITLSNPKVILFYCGFLPTFLDLGNLSAADVTLVAGVIGVVLSTVLSLYAYLASSARRWFSGRRGVRRLNRAAGGVMIATGVAIASRS